MKQEIEFEPPKPKHLCPDCKRMFRKLQKCRDGIKRCKLCLKRLITNRFYKKPEKTPMRRFFYKKTTDWKVLYHNYLSQGLSRWEAYRRASKHIYMLKHNKVKKQVKKEDKNKLFIIGLKHAVTIK